MFDPQNDPDFDRTKAAIERGIEQADRGETLSIAEAKALAIEAVLRVAAERDADQA